MLRAIAPLAFLAAAMGCANAQDSSSPQPGAPAVTGALIMPKPLVVPVAGAGGEAIGSATFTEAPEGVLIRLELEAGSLSPGWHGVHLHEKADCSDAAYKLSGAHVGHGAGTAKHGLLNPDGPEFGDLPNLLAPGKGSGTFGTEIFSPFVTLASTPMDGRAPLLDSDGSALIIHAGPDDHESQPIGGAGDRVACAAIRR